MLVPHDKALQHDAIWPYMTIDHIYIRARARTGHIFNLHHMTQIGTFLRYWQKVKMGKSND